MVALWPRTGCSHTGRAVCGLSVAAQLPITEMAVSHLHAAAVPPGQGVTCKSPSESVWASSADSLIASSPQNLAQTPPACGRPLPAGTPAGRCDRLSDTRSSVPSIGCYFHVLLPFLINVFKHCFIQRQHITLSGSAPQAAVASR